jgi:hypothetical protein
VVALFVSAAVVAWFLPFSKMGENRAYLINASLVVVGSTVILLYQRRMSATSERRANDARREHMQLRSSFASLEEKFQAVQTNLDLAIADCEELRSLNEKQSLEIAGLAGRAISNLESENS